MKKLLIVFLLLVGNRAWCIPEVVSTSLVMETGSTVYGRMGARWIYVNSAIDNLIIPCTSSCYTTMIVTSNSVMFETALANSKNAEPGQTWGEATEGWRGGGYTGGVRLNVRDSLSSSCATFVLSRTPAYDEDSSKYLDEADIIARSPVCVPVVATNSCSLYFSDVNLDHGNLHPRDIEGHVASNIVQVQCGSPLPVKFSLSPAGDLLLKNGEISSHLTIADKNVGTVMNLQTDKNELEIKSTLHAEKTITAGTFSGSQTLILTVQ